MVGKNSIAKILENFLNPAQKNRLKRLFRYRDIVKNQKHFTQL